MRLAFNYKTSTASEKLKYPIKTMEKFFSLANIILYYYVHFAVAILSVSFTFEDQIDEFKSFVIYYQQVNLNVLDA